MKKITWLICIVILAGAALFTSCQSVKDIPQDLSAPQLLQRGQSYSDNADYKNAEACYLATIDRYGDDTATYIEAKYELAHLYLKIRKGTFCSGRNSRDL